ncbi:MAG TPA: hypothetical protein VGO18_01245 [Steroidobacteraceae bacterium]|jgi:hypothetical protein|nr:hypothetical protein [Steroidobacteraceae bacterium]
MNAQDAIVPFTAVLMLGLIWIRTRIQYSRPGTGPLKLQRAGRIYFGAALALLAIGWFVAPMLGRTFWPVPGVTPTLMRVVWCLATYYVFIAVHRAMKRRGAAVFEPQADPLV